MNMKETVIRNAAAYVREVFRADHSGHDAAHTMRVFRTACRLAESEGADRFLVGLAALLHDVDDVKLSPETHAGKDRAVSFMHSLGLDSGVIRRICEIIGEVSYAGRDSAAPGTIEGKCVQDADRLDALGAVGIARAFAYGGSHGRVMYDPEVPPKPDMSGEEYRRHVSTTVNHFYEKLFRLEDLMNTAAAKALAERRSRYMHEYLEEFLAEWEGDL